MSLATWIVILIKALDLRRIASQSRATESFWHSADFAEGRRAFLEKRPPQFEGR